MLKRLLILMASAIILLPSCSKDIFSQEDIFGPQGQGQAQSQDSGSDQNNTTGISTASADLSGAVSDGDVKTFSIAFDKTALDEKVSVQSDDDDYIENTTFAQTININYDGDKATVTGDTDGIVTVKNADVTVNNTGSKVIMYVLSGKTTDGFFKVYGSKKQGITLNGVNITNPDGAAINNQNKKRTFVVLTDGTSNYLTDGTEYKDATEDEDMKGTIFSEAQLIFSGKGYLEIDANAKAGINSDDYVRFMPGCNIYVDASSGNGIRGKDAVTVTGGVMNINITGTADKGISSDGTVTFDGGRATIITSGGYEVDSDSNDYTACAGVKADSTFTMNAGELLCMSSGIGGKGISCDQEAVINGGTIKIITTGKYASKGSMSVSPKGIRADGNLAIKGGHLVVRATGGEGSEGIESKGELTISGGTVESYAYDDAINSAGNMTITGGYVYVQGTKNDGLDANKNIYINGGVVIAVGGTTPEVPIDAAEKYYIFINGGTIAAFGQSIASTASDSKQASVTTTASTNTNITLYDGDTAVMAIKTPASSGGTAVQLSSPSLKSGSKYTLKTGGTFSGGNEFYGMVTGGTVSGASGSTSLTAAYSVGSSMGGGNMGGGGGFGGR